MQIKRYIAMASLFSGIIFSGAAVAVETTQPPVSEGFTAGEHVTIGDEVKLNLPEGKLLHLPNGLALTYGQIVSLGDFYGTPSQPIAYGKTKADRNHLFMQAFAQFSETASVIPEVQDILDVTLEEQSEIKHAIAHGESVAEVYKRISEDHNRRYNCITGGGCDGKWWLKQGRYLDLAKSDYDHFGDTALVAYQVGHELAIEKAIIAHANGSEEQLELAYAMNAFASHFLSDRFAAGHLRVPRRELDTNTTPTVVGSLLSHYMHDEEGEHGLHVHNARGDRWVAYGDKHYFDRDNAQHRYLIREAMQISADEVYAAYRLGVATSDVTTTIAPVPDVTGEVLGHDVAPMFYWDSAHAALYRRKDLSNPGDFHFTTDWWGWSTFLELSSLYGLPHG